MLIGAAFFSEDAGFGMGKDMNRRIREELLGADGVCPGDTGIVAVSGGADSVFLLRILESLAEELKLRLVVVHVHHGIRGEEADRDAAFTKALAAELALPFREVRVDALQFAKDEHLSVEEAARILRFKALKEIKAEEGAAWIALAHHRDDLVETILFHLIRGTGLRGLRGILPRQEDCIRPLLSLYRSDITEWLKEKGYSWCEDTTNQDIHYARNRIRHRIIPEMLAVNSGAKEHLRRLAEDAAFRYNISTAEAEKLRDEVIRQQDGTVLITDMLFGKASAEEIREELLFSELSGLSRGRKDLTEKHLKAVLELREKESGKKISLPYGLEAMRTAEGILLYRRSGNTFSMELRVERRPYTPGEPVPRDERSVLVDAALVHGEPVLRTPQEGDRIILGNEGQGKKLLRFFTDRKIPDIYRGMWPVVADEDGVFWVVGLRLDMRCRVTEDTKEVLCLSFLGDLPYDIEKQDEKRKPWNAKAE